MFAPRFLFCFIDNGMEPPISSLKLLFFASLFFYSDHVIFSSWRALNDIGSPAVFHARRRRRQQSTHTPTGRACCCGGDDDDDDGDTPERI